MIFTLISAHHYPHVVEERIGEATNQIILAAMVIHEGDRMHGIFQALQEALSRGVKVSLYSDIYSSHIVATNPTGLRSFQRGKTTLAQTQRTLQALISQGAEIIPLGTMGFHPYKGRFHQKFICIDDTVFLGGGINLTDSSFDQADYMFETSSPDLVALLTSQVKDFTHHMVTPDKRHKINTKIELLIDGGQPHSSLIYDTAVQLSKQAEAIIYVSQLAPSGPLARILAQKHADCYFTPASRMQDPSILSQAFDPLFYGIQNHYRRQEYIHAKYMLFQLANGQQVSLSGSHNFSYRGVRYGTKELALVSRDPQIYKALDSFFVRFIQ